MFALSAAADQAHPGDRRLGLKVGLRIRGTPGRAASREFRIAMGSLGASSICCCLPLTLPPNDPEGNARFSQFTQGLQELGWIDNRNIRMDVRWAAGNVDRMQMFAKELVGLQPDVMLANSTPATAAFQRETRTIPIVFAGPSDPVGDGFVAGLPRPGGNITGLIGQEASLAGKCLELLTEIAPGVKRAAIMFNPDTPSRRQAHRGARPQAARYAHPACPCLTNGRPLCGPFTLLRS